MRRHGANRPVRGGARKARARRLIAAAAGCYMGGGRGAAGEYRPGRKRKAVKPEAEGSMGCQEGENGSWTGGQGCLCGVAEGDEPAGHLPRLRRPIQHLRPACRLGVTGGHGRASGERGGGRGLGYGPPLVGPRVHLRLISRPPPPLAPSEPIAIRIAARLTHPGAGELEEAQELVILGKGPGEGPDQQEGRPLPRQRRRRRGSAYASQRLPSEPSSARIGV
jgi:hypothetical protein